MQNTFEKITSDENKFAKTAVSLAKFYLPTMLVGAAAAYGAPTDEAAWAITGLALVTNTVLGLMNNEQVAADLGYQTSAQKKANKAMEKQIREMERKQKSQAAKKSDNWVEDRLNSL